MSIWKHKLDLAQINERSKGSLSDYLKIVYTEVGEDFLKAEMNVQSYHLQPFGIVHGGANCVLAESVGSAAANFCIDQKSKVAVGLDININHIKAVKQGVIEAIAKPLHLGKSTQVWEIKLFYEKKLSAISRLTLAIMDR